MAKTNNKTRMSRSNDDNTDTTGSVSAPQPPAADTNVEIGASPRSSSSSFVRSRWFGVTTLVRLVILLGLVPHDLSVWVLDSPGLQSILVDPIYTVKHVREAVALQQLRIRGGRHDRKMRVLDRSGHNNTTAATLGSNHRYVFADAYRIPGQIHLPPLLLAVIEPVVKYANTAMSDSISSIMPTAALSYYFGDPVGGSRETMKNDEHTTWEQEKERWLFWQQHVMMGVVVLVVDIMIAWTLERIGWQLIRYERDVDPWEGKLMVKMPAVIRPKLSHIYEIMPCSSSTPSSSSSDIKENTNDKETEENNNDKLSDDHDAPTFRLADMPWMAAALYYASPIVILASSGSECSFQNIKLMLVLLATLSSLRTHDSSITLSAFCLALAAYIDFHAVVFCVPIAAAFRIRQQQGIRNWLVFPFMFVFLSMCLQSLSVILVGKELYPSVVTFTHGHVFRLHGLEPSLSLMWYFQMEVFDQFYGYFTIMLGGLPYLLVAPIAIRLYKYPIVLVATYWLIWTVFRPTMTLYDLNVGLCLMWYSPRSLARMGTTLSLVCLCGMGIPVTLYLVMHWMWLETNTGEANFLYFQCFAYNVLLSLLLLDFTGASLRRDKALRLTAKGPPPADDRDDVNNEATKEESVN